ncbi:class I SAM-dependent methyltransferase [Cryptosporangium aurantiacum]|uniref:Methyltransferase domain-containing protein n=1 Tax=Cryptosporangium aurantiacum TaxID=134849 RepID=A0A1M7RJV5_9ACTN|nr:class I SAM-dependent methyltransferase [Cryptosporangium aurantiacum]SHN46625.1 Methyltransferase domain-containing protein [Cryptosporangium aurantiacum]
MTADLHDLVRRWDAQQAAYIAGREQRFTAMLDVLELTVGGDATIVDLGCGPGSLTRRVLERFPRARVVALDYDPVLLALARKTLSEYGERVTVVDVDLLDPHWTDGLGALSAAVSTTALHWLAPDELLRLYARVHALLTPGGVLLDGDHFRFDDRDPVLQKVALAHDERTQQVAFAAGAEDWATWWDAARAHPALSPHVAERDRRYGARTSAPATTVDFRLAALRQAGFGATGTVWQLLDDYVVWAQK